MKAFLLVLLIILLSFPYIAYAGIGDVVISVIQGITCYLTGAFCPDTCSQLISLTNGTAAYRLCKLVDRISSALYIIAWSLALVVILIGGISYMTSAGEEEKIQKAKKIIKNGLIGTAIVLCSGFILNLLVDLLAPLFYPIY